MVSKARLLIRLERVQNQCTGKIEIMIKLGKYYYNIICINNNI